MSKVAASSRAFASMLSYSLRETDMPFSLFPKAGLRLQSRRNTVSPNRLEEKMHPRAEAASETTSETTPSWPEDIFNILQRFDVAQVPYVPDAGHSQLIERVLGASSMRAVPLTTEEEGVALLAGAWAGGQRGVLLMQSSGVGNCVNMLSLTQIFRFPFLTLVTMRGGHDRARDCAGAAQAACGGDHG